MKSKKEVLARPTIARKPPKEEISDAEFQRRLKNIAQWRKQRLAELRAKNPC
jgi:hypothetical protein